MSLQILDIVIYSHDGKRRVLPLRPGRLNVITGASKTGKSSLIDIVDYCFGSDQCRVPEGPIRRCVSWFGLRLQLADGQAFVARRCPDKQAASSEECYIEVADSLDAPDFNQLRQTTNTKGLSSTLGGWCGIHDNIHIPALGETRAPITASVRHALPLCFQPQDEIIRRHQLFHGAADHFVAQSLKDTLPYFLGAVGDDYVRKRGELRKLREELRHCERQIAELAALRGDGISKAASLLAQARDMELTIVTADTWEGAISALREIASKRLSDIKAVQGVNTEFDRLSNERGKLLGQQGRLREEISSARAFEQDESGFSREAKEQQARLKTIGVFDDVDADHACPLCAQKMPPESTIPTSEEIKKTLEASSVRLDSVSRVKPQIEKAISELETQLQAVQRALAKNRTEMEAVQSANERLAQVQDEMIRRTHILGRISLYLESLPELPDTKSLESKAKVLRDHCEDLEEELSDELIQQRIASIVSILGQQMTKGAQDLALEHSKFPLRLDVKRLTIVADTVDGPVPMDRMGSGENWVGYHLIAHLALHRWFTERNRPVPRFLFLDQPSQVYFPPEKDIDGSMGSILENDRAAVSRMFNLVARAVQEISPGFQVIMTEHADIDEKWYQEAIVERWRGGHKLVPDEWPRQAGASK